jgi:hypothetical protein
MMKLIVKMSCPYKDPGTDLEIINDDVEFCNAHLPEYDIKPQSAAQALLSKESKHWWKTNLYYPAFPLSFGCYM